MGPCLNPSAGLIQPAHLFHATALVGVGCTSLIKQHSCVLSPSEEPRKIYSMTQQCLADGEGGISLVHMELVARKLSYKALRAWGDGQVRELFAIYSFPLLFVSDVSSEQLKIPEEPQAWIIRELVSQFGLLPILC